MTLCSQIDKILSIVKGVIDLLGDEEEIDYIKEPLLNAISLINNIQNNFDIQADTYIKDEEDLAAENSENDYKEE